MPSTIRFRVNPQKALEAIIWLAHKQPGITFHTVLKTLYYADKSHLNRHGRPILGDTYYALQFGPVGSFVYDVLKGEPSALEALGCEGGVPFRKEGYRVYAERNPNTNVFSPSDLEALEQSFRENRGLSFGDLTDKSHKERAWLEAGGGAMAYEHMLEGAAADEEAVEDLRQVGLRLVI